MDRNTAASTAGLSVSVGKIGSEAPAMTEAFDWTERDLEGSLYYPACGDDFQALYRFSHLVRRFVYADWDVPVSKVPALLAKHPRLELLRVVDNPVVLPAAPETDRRQARAQTGAASVTSRGFIVRRTVGGERRDLELLFVCGEAFSVYRALYAARGVAPSILYTVNSGADEGGAWTRLEEADGLFDRFVVGHGVVPRLRIRGGYVQNPIEGGTRWPTRVQNFALQSMLVRAYAREPLDLADRVELAGVRTVTLRRRALSSADLARGAPLFVSPRIADHLTHGAKHPLLHVLREPTTWPELLEQVERVCTERGCEEAIVSVVPYGDEGQLLREWSERAGKPSRLEVRFVDELDLADLRGFRAVR